MAHPSAVRLIPDCRVSVDGKKLEPELDGRLTRVEVDLDVDLFGQCVLVFNDPAQKLINGKDFQSGTAVKVEIGFAAKLQKVFEGEVVALEPQFRRDMPPSLRVVCQEGLHRLALSQMTRSFLDVDDKEIVGKIATEHGLSGEAPAGSKQHVLQGNVTDAVFLRRLAQKHGNHLRIEGKKLIVGPPPKGAELTIGPGDGTRKVKVRIQTKDQVEEIAVHGYDPRTKQEFVGKAKGAGVTGEGTQKYGKGKTLSFAGNEHQPTDQATAEAMAKGRMRKLAEGHVTASIESIGDPGMLPGATVKLEKLGAQIDGSYRVEKALHQFSKHGYLVTFKAVRTAKAKPPAPVKPAPAPAPAAPAPAAPAPAAPASAAPAPAAATPPAQAHGGTGSAGTGSAGTGAAPAANTKINFRFEPASGFCGDRIHLKAETENLADGTAVTVTLTPSAGSSPRLAAIHATVRGNRIDAEFQIANVDFGAGNAAAAEVSLTPASTNAAQVTSAGPLQVRARRDAPAQHFSEQRTWRDNNSNPPVVFSTHPRFDQHLEHFRNKVEVTADLMKGWGATYVNLGNLAPGTAGGCPWANHRWARAASPNDMTPTEYYDGTNWVPLPATFNRDDASKFFSVAFIESGSSFVMQGSPSTVYPVAFGPYDFNSSAYTSIRNGWISRVHSYWTEKWALRRNGCPSDPSVNCCRYEVEVTLTLRMASSYGADVIVVGPGNYRSSASTFFMGDSRPGVVPHEIGHLMDNPDEYLHGANDQTLNGDGASHGIDETCIMGSELATVKKRHYHAFAFMLQKLVHDAYGNGDSYDIVPR